MYPNNGSCCWTCMPSPSWKPCWTAFITRSAPNFCSVRRNLACPLLWVRDAGAQAVYAAEHFTGQKLPEAVIADTHRKLKRDLSNVAIIGMPGCGKSTIGRALAKTLGKTYVDLDEVIEKNTGMPIPDIFAREGEASFRKYESQAVAEISKQTRQVIACGGGGIPVVRRDGKLYGTPPSSIRTLPLPSSQSSCRPTPRHPDGGGPRLHQLGQAGPEEPCGNDRCGSGALLRGGAFRPRLHAAQGAGSPVLRRVRPRSCGSDHSAGEGQGRHRG